jgi:hypothetical protein
VKWGIRQLLLSTMRHYRDMPAKPRKEKDLPAKAGCCQADENVLYEFATLAYQLGFASRQIDDIRGMSSDRKIARSALLKARRPDRYKYDHAKLGTHIDKIVRLRHCRPRDLRGLPGIGLGFPTRILINKT